MEAKSEVLSWLRDAYAMERGLEVSLKAVSDSSRHPLEYRNACATHLAQTQRHAQTIELLLKTHGSAVSTMKTGISLLTGAMKGFGTAMSRDEVIKDLLTSYAMEHFEIACYRAIIAAAETTGLTDVSQACEQIIPNEEKMAETISTLLPRVVYNYFTETTQKKAA